LIKQRAENNFLHRCNGCELVLAKQLGAQYVVVPWIFRMSKLIQTMYLEIREVQSGKVVVRIGRNFRGNTEQSWQHVIDSLVTTLDNADH
jgi:hypothetical protein